MMDLDKQRNKQLRQIIDKENKNFDDFSFMKIFYKTYFLQFSNYLTLFFKAEQFEQSLDKIQIALLTKHIIIPQNNFVSVVRG